VIENIAGREVGYLTMVAETRIMEYTGQCKRSSIVWLCSCLCGQIAFYSRKTLMEGHVRTCSKTCPFYRVRELLWDKMYHDWTVLREPPRKEDRRVYWRCQCKCGERRWVIGRHLIAGDSKSCGCRFIEQRRASMRKINRERRLAHVGD